MWLLPLLLVGVIPVLAAQDASTTTTDATDSIMVITGIATSYSEPAVPTGDYITYSSTITLSTSGESTPTGNATTSGTRTGNSTATATDTSSLMLIGGEATGSRSANATASTSTSAPVVNTRPCNGYPEFCARSYSNITMVAAHNSPFTRPGNAASNQALGVTSQLNDGIRMRMYPSRRAEYLDRD